MGTDPAKIPTTNPLPECAARRVIASRPAALRSLSQLRRALVARRSPRYPNQLLTFRPSRGRSSFGPESRCGRAAWETISLHAARGPRPRERLPGLIQRDRFGPWAGTVS
jgi:hypothetical protein